VISLTDCLIDILVHSLMIRSGTVDFGKW